jgi:hypothetical protein
MGFHWSYLDYQTAPAATHAPLLTSHPLMSAPVFCGDLHVWPIADVHSVDMRAMRLNTCITHDPVGQPGIQSPTTPSLFVAGWRLVVAWWIGVKLSAGFFPCLRKENNKPMSSHDNITAELERCLADDGIWGALAYLNKRVTHRFTALHIKDVEVLKNVYVHDRDSPAAKPFMNVPVYETFCALVSATEQPLVINDATQDSRAIEAVQHAAIKAYCGLPLYRSDGSLFGTLCHYDYVPRDVDAAELEVLRSASHMLSATLNNIAAL